MEVWSPVTKVTAICVTLDVDDQQFCWPNRVVND